MKLEYYPLKKLKKEIIDIVGKHLDLSAYRVFFFGSRVTGKGDERSDIDVGIEGPAAVPSRAMIEILWAIERLHTLYKIDVVDMRRVSPGFYRVAKEKIENVAR
jgi:predicted nucleotidyltransferase